MVVSMDLALATEGFEFVDVTFEVLVVSG